MFLNCSTCFERHTAHRQELKNCNCSLWFYILLWLPAAVMFPLSHDSCRQPKHMYNQRLQLQFLSSWGWAVCRSEHVEQLRNIGIINSTTRSHLVGYFYRIYIMMHGSMNIEMLCSDTQTETNGQTDVTNLPVCFFFTIVLWRCLKIAL